MAEAPVSRAAHTPAAASVLGQGRAPGKVILLGEHAVVYGHPAVACALDRGVHVRVLADPAGPVLRAPHWGLNTPLSTSADVGPLGVALERVRLAVAPQLRAVALEAQDVLPLGSGLGSSAALTVAAARALADAAGVSLSTAQLTDAVHAAEQVFHGNPSGVDQATVIDGGVLRFQRMDPPPHRVEAVAMPAPLTVVVALMRPHLGTRAAVEALGRLRTSQPRTVNLLMEELGALAQDGVAALGQGQWTTLGQLMDLAHGILHALGVSSNDLDALVRSGRELGALGAKLTGAGVGGAVVMCTDGDPVGVHRLVVGLRGQGAQAFSAVVGGPTAANGGVR